MTITPSPGSRAWLDQEDAHVADIIRRKGVCLQLVGTGGCSHPGCSGFVDAGPPFAYTIGLFGIAHPELVVVGLGSSAATFVLNSVAGRVLAGVHLLPGDEIDDLHGNRRLVVETVPNPGDIAFGANRHYARPREASVPLLQLSYADSRGRFPSDPRYSGSRRRQPRPGTWNARGAD